MDISSLLEVQVDEVQQSTPLNTELIEYKPKTPDTLKPSQVVSIEETLFYKNLFEYDTSQVRFRRLHCTACDVHIGSAPVDAQNMQEHPILKTLLCSSCRIFYGDGEFEQGDDATDMFCRWCANGGNLYCCSYCSSTFCDKCIKRNFDTEIRAKIEADEKWKCFVCDPQDLYMHRAVCRALLQHVRVLARLIMEDCSMSEKEIESKMEMDDSKCCPGRRARRKRRNSDSDFEDDEDHGDGDHPKQRKRTKNGSTHKRRKSTSSTQENTQVTLNGTSRFIPIAPKYVLQEMVAIENNKSDDQEDLPPPLLQCEQSMIECENQTVTPQGIVLPASKYQQTQIPDSILNNSAITLNPVSKRTLVRTAQASGRPITIRPLQKVTSIPPGATIHRLPSNVPMVTIPSGAPILALDSPKNKSLEKTSQSGNYLRCKSNLTTTPSVINIDSDSEEVTAIESSNTQKAAENDHINKEKETHTEVERNTKLPASSKKCKFNDAINHPLKQIDDLLKVFRKRLKVDYQKMRHISDDEILDKREKLKIINNNIENIVNDLAAFNNSMVAKYKPWKQAHLNGESFDDSIKTVVLKKNERSSKFTPLDMECVRDSEPEEEELEDDDEMDINSLLDFSKKVTKIIEIKDSISQGTLTEIETENKAVQCYNVPEEIDFDKSIGYSLLMRADYDFEKKEEIFKPVIIHDKHFGKYEEQFIFYLQDWEDRKENSSDEKLKEIEETPLMNLIDADLAREDELEESINDQLNSITDSTTITTASFRSLENSDEHLSNCEDVGNPDKKYNEKNDSLTPVKPLNDCRQTTNSKKRKLSVENVDNNETLIAVNSLIDEKVNIEPFDNWKSSSNDDECTIVE